jgi:hypothetical protein
MRVIRTYWNRRLFAKAEDAYRIEIIIYASKKEIEGLRKMEVNSIAQTLQEAKE